MCIICSGAVRKFKALESFIDNNCVNYPDLLTWFQDQEVRLFDKGELNTYRDELNFASSLIFHLDSLLESLPAGPDLSAVISLQVDHCREIFDDLLPELKKFDLGATFLRDGDFNNLMIKLKRVQKLANVLQRYDVTLKSNVDCLNAALCAFHVVVWDWF